MVASVRLVNRWVQGTGPVSGRATVPWSRLFLATRRLGPSEGVCGILAQAIGHSDQITHRVGLQLSDEIGPVQLHRAFPGAQPPGDLFVQKSLRHQLEDLALARSEQVEPLVQLEVLRTRLPDLLALGEPG